MKKIYASALVVFGVVLGILYSNINTKSKLDKYYLDRLTMIKSGMIYGSQVDTQQEIGDYQDQTELCMHLDGYNGIEVMKLRSKAFEDALEKGD